MILKRLSQQLAHRGASSLSLGHRICKNETAWASARSFASKTTGEDGGRILVNQIPVNPFAMNMFVVACEKTKKAAVIDCGTMESEFSVIPQIMEREGYELDKFLQTHCHVDHVLGLGHAKKAYPDVGIFMHSLDKELYDQAGQVAVDYGFPPIETLPQDNITFLDDMPSISVGELVFDILFVPGHCPGHVAFYHKESKSLFSGDVLFKQGIGRTDFPTSNTGDMVESLKKLMELDDDVIVHPGHGDLTTILNERKTNPFLAQMM